MPPRSPWTPARRAFRTTNEKPVRRQARVFGFVWGWDSGRVRSQPGEAVVKVGETPRSDTTARSDDATHPKIARMIAHTSADPLWTDNPGAWGCEPRDIWNMRCAHVAKAS